MDPPFTVYVVGIPQSGGCWLSSGECYLNYSWAEEKLKQDQKAGDNYSRIFPLNVKDRSAAK